MKWFTICLQNRTLESIALLRNISDTLEDDPLLLSYLLRIVANACGFSSLSNIKVKTKSHYLLVAYHVSLFWSLLILGAPGSWMGYFASGTSGNS